MNKKLALFHPWIKSKGGAERVVLEILKHSKHNIEVYTWFYDKEKTFPEFKEYSINVIAPKIGKIFSNKKISRGFLFLLGMIKKIPLKDKDGLIISTSGVSEFITFRNKIKGKTFAYVHTPLREANSKIITWNLKNNYKNFLGRIYYLLAIKIYKFLEKKSWNNLDVLVFNSKLSHGRAKEDNLISSQKVQIIYPPIKLSKIKVSKKREHFVYISRINPPKRQDVLIEAWEKFSQEFPKEKLLIVGNVDSKDYFKKISKKSSHLKNIKIKTNVSDSELEKIVSKSKAGIFLGYSEDFGMVPLEIISSGIPLISVDEGGFVEIIGDNSNFHKIPEKHSNQDMVKEVFLALKKFMQQKISKNPSKKIKYGSFIKEFDDLIEKQLSNL